ncbi:hypothetical protein [Kineococcus terrestris]|uniref:hypothetical protein n=1 Tax=Kineococcus terrestris TaxID=2044856 RepID=UPI0034DAFF61
MYPSQFEQAVLGRRPQSPQAPPAHSGKVTRSDETGVWVTTIGQSQLHPSGPCKGARYDVLVDVDGRQELRSTALPIGTLVAWISTEDGPWVLAAEVTRG